MLEYVEGTADGTTIETAIINLISGNIYAFQIRGDQMDNFVTWFNTAEPPPNADVSLVSVSSINRDANINRYTVLIEKN